ncbi:MAG: segregation/condensation protein A [Thermodesulfovibrionales bacterium]|nr:segregation/condensation protein A [Thermodesulfovibrionales bacterium]
MEETAYKIKLPLFEGPMDLLLHLIREHKLDIYDIPISLITRQYLEYIEVMKELNLEVAGDFLVMAATLIHIKSRMLLPVEDTADTDEPEDPRLELVMRLLEYKAFKEAAHGLQERETDQSNVYTRIPSGDEGESEDELEELSLFDLNLFDLITSFQKMLERAPAEAQTLTREVLTVKDKMAMIIDSLQSMDAMRFTDLFKSDIIKMHFVVTFVAMLELIRLGLARVYQDGPFGEVWIINPDSSSTKEEIIRQKIAPDAGGGPEGPAPEAPEAREEEETETLHPYEEPYEFEEGHPYKKSKPFQKYRQFENSHPYGDSVLKGFADKSEEEPPENTDDDSTAEDSTEDPEDNNTEPSDD